MELDKAIQLRKSIRNFQRKKPDWRDIIECIDACRYAPMAGGIFTPKFILVDEKEKINKIAEAAQQGFISKAHYVLVVCSKIQKTVDSYGKRGEIYSRQQAGAAIQNFLLKIEEKNLSTCWVGQFVESQVKRILQISDDIQIEAVFPIGYAFPSDKKRKKRKIDFDNVLYFHKYGNKRMEIPRMPYT
jgi:nitroreductase